MNLSLILNMAPGSASATPANGNIAQGPVPAEMASFQDFLSLMGLSPMAADDGLDLSEGDAAAIDPALLAAMPGNEPGNLLPPALPALPVLPDSAALPANPAQLAHPAVVLSAAVQSSPQPAATAEQVTRDQPRSAFAVPLALPPQAAPSQAPLAGASLPVPPDVLAAAVAQSTLPNPAQRPQPALQPAPLPADIAFDLPLPAATQSQASAPQVALQAGAQPVLAQLLQGNQRLPSRKGGDEVAVAPAAAATATRLSLDASSPAVPAPILPATATPAIAVVAPDTAQAHPSATATPAPPAPVERHDFSAVIDRLAEARELARPGRADMHLAHREFGQVSVQFELAGQALKVAMTSADPGFAPAVQAALAERQVAPGTDAARADSQPQRSDSVNASNPSWQAGPQADGQRQEGQSRAQQARTGNGPIGHNDGDADNGGASPGDGSRFA